VLSVTSAMRRPETASLRVPIQCRDLLAAEIA
jgi:hypothetical protein